MLYSFPFNAFGNAIMKDCNTIIDNYKKYPASGHASNARFILERVRTYDKYGDLYWNNREIKDATNIILTGNYSIQCISENETEDGPTNLAYCANVKEVFTAEMQNLLHKPYKTVKNFADNYKCIVFKTYSEPAELQTDSTMKTIPNRLEVTVYVGLNIHEEFVQQVDCFKNGFHISMAKI